MGLDDDWEAGCDAIEDEFGDVESPVAEDALCELERTYCGDLADSGVALSASGFGLGQCASE
jgi:hypothetical protein